MPSAGLSHTRSFIGLLEGVPSSSNKPVHLVITMPMPMGEHDLTATCIDCAEYGIGDDLGGEINGLPTDVYR